MPRISIWLYFCKQEKEQEPSPKFSKKEWYYGNEILRIDLTHKKKILGQL